MVVCLAGARAALELVHTPLSIGWKELGLVAVRSMYSYSITNEGRYIAFFAACVSILATGSVLIMHHPAKSPAIAVT